MITMVGAYEAKTRFAQLLDEVSGGRTITISRHGVPVARLVPATPVAVGDPDDVVAQFREARQGLRLDGLAPRDLIDEGRP